MSTVAVVGASLLGGHIAHTLARQPFVREVRLIDPAGQVAQGVALDIQQAGAVERFDTRIVATSTVRDVVGASLSVLAGPVGQTSLEWDDGGGLEMLGHIARLNPRAVTVCAGSRHGPLMEHAVARTLAPRRQLVGSAPHALVSAVKALVALELRGSAQDVSLTIVGRAPAGWVVSWHGASFGGVGLTACLSPSQRARLEERIRLAWPPGPYALAAAAAHLCGAVLRGTAGRGLPCFAVLDGELGGACGTMAVTAALDRTGVTRIVEPVLSPHEQTRFDNTCGSR